jgi:methyltransferase (TIGR00027 family)
MIAALARGSHLLSHGPRAVLQDWLAWPLIGSEAETMRARARSAFGDSEPLLATWVAARSRFAEDWLAGSGAGNYVILGAGLDSFAWRQGGGVHVLEIDHPATQAWKRSRLQALAVPEPHDLTWLPVDFEVESVADALARAALGAGPIFVSWLGVVSYLSLAAIDATLDGLPPCSLAVSYGTPQDAWPEAVRAASQTFRAIAVDAGEPPVSRFTPDTFAALLADRGFRVVEDFGSEDVEPRLGLAALSIGNERVTLASNSTS